MAKLYHSFVAYNKKIKLSDEDRKKLVVNRESLRKRMRENYKKLPVDVRKAIDMRFQSQGSFVMDTIIKPQSEDYDLDDGVYFIGDETREERQETEVFHGWVTLAVDQDLSYEKITDKDTCVRVAFKNKSHIDLPIYYFFDEHPDLAHLKLNWMISDPIEFIAWFEDKIQSGFQKRFLTEYANESDNYKTWLNDIRKNDHQLRRIVRYLKGWADFVGGDMPCGLILTILAAENYSPNLRDDIALKDALRAIYVYLRSNGVKCFRPTTPVGEDLFASTSSENKHAFMDKLSVFLYDAEKAIVSLRPEDSAALWAKHLGPRFRLVDADKETAKLESPKKENLGQIITERPWFPKH